MFKRLDPEIQLLLVIILTGIGAFVAVAVHLITR